MKNLFAIPFLLIAISVNAEVIQTASSGAIEFATLKAAGIAPQRTIKLKNKLDLELNLSVRSEDGHEFLNVTNEVSNPTGAALHYILYVAFLDEGRNLVGVANCEDVFSRGVQPGSTYQCASRVSLPQGKYKAIRSYQAMLYVSERPLQ